MDAANKNYRSRVIDKLLSDEAGLQDNFAQALQQGAFSRLECLATIKQSKQLIHRIARDDRYADLLAFLDRVDRLALKR